LANGNGRDLISWSVTDCERAGQSGEGALSVVYDSCINRTGPMRIPAARFSDASLTMMISDLCAQHPKLTGIRKEQNAVYLKELAAEKVRRAA
jgi:hypothetical protein